MKSILIVDDLEFMRYSESRILKKGGYNIAGEAINGKDALEKYKELRPDLVLMDITMPVMDGLTASEKILDADPEAKIIICSSLGQPKVIVQAIELGVKEFIVLPFKEERLLKVVEKILKYA